MRARRIFHPDLAIRRTVRNFGCDHSIRNSEVLGRYRYMTEPHLIDSRKAGTFNSYNISDPAVGRIERFDFRRVGSESLGLVTTNNYCDGNRHVLVVGKSQGFWRFGEHFEDPISHQDMLVIQWDGFAFSI